MDIEQAYWSIPDECRPPHHQITYLNVPRGNAAAEPGHPTPHTVPHGTTLARVRSLPPRVDIVVIGICSTMLAFGLFLLALWFQLIP